MFSVRDQEGPSDKDQIHSWRLGFKYEDLKKGRKVPGKATVYLKEPRLFRLDVYDPFGFVQVGQLIVNGEYMRVQAMGQKDYAGPVDQNKIQALLKTKVLPEELMGLFTQTKLSQLNWNCSVDGLNRATDCLRSEGQVRAQWTGPMSQVGSVLSLFHTRAKLFFTVKSYKSLAGEKLDLFDF